MDAESLVPNPLADGHLPWFVTPPGQTDILFNIMIVFMILIVFAVGVLYLKLHSLPEHMMHGTNKVQVQFVGVLALLALFTHNNALWITALLLALIEIPDFRSPLKSIASSLERIANRDDNAALPPPDPHPPAPDAPVEGDSHA